MLINPGEEECNVAKTTHFQSWFNAVRRKSDSTEAFLEHLEVQIFKILMLGANHGDPLGWPSTWHNSTDPHIRALDQPPVEKEYLLIELLIIYIPIKYFSFYMHLLWFEVFDFFMLQYQEIICSPKNVIKESGRGLQYCQLFLLKIMTMKKLPCINK